MAGEWRLFFDPSNMKCQGSSTITVTRTGAETDPATGLDTWEIEAGENDVACLAKVVGGRVFLEFSGLYRMPFKITVQKK